MDNDDENETASKKTGGPGRRKGTTKNIASFPAKLNLATLCRVHTEAALDCLLRLMDDDTCPHPTRLAAANSLLDRGYGKAPQAHTHDVNTTSFAMGLSLTPEQLMRLDADELHNLERALIKLTGASQAPESGTSDAGTEEKRRLADEYESTLH